MKDFDGCYYPDSEGPCNFGKIVQQNEAGLGVCKVKKEFSMHKVK